MFEADLMRDMVSNYRLILGLAAVLLPDKLKMTRIHKEIHDQKCLNELDPFEKASNSEKELI